MTICALKQKISFCKCDDYQATFTKDKIVTEKFIGWVCVQSRFK